MNSGKKAFLILCSILVVFAIPILFFSEQRQAALETYVSGEQFIENRLLAAFVIVMLFSGDIFLPIPSSAVCAVAGKLFGILMGTALCWIGLNLSALVGYWFSWVFGWKAIGWLSGKTEVAEVKSTIDQWGIWPIVLLRPIPVLAEASILMLGTYRYPASKFWPPMMVANLIFAVVFVSLGSLFAQQDQFLTGVAISCALPFTMALIWIWFANRNSMVKANDTLG